MSLIHWLPLINNFQDIVGGAATSAAPNRSLPTSGATGKIGAGYTFNNSGVKVDGVQLTGEMSFALWIKLSSSSACHILDARGITGEAGYQPMYYSGSGIQIYSSNGGGSDYINCNLGTTWHHLAVIISNNVGKLYMDGNFLGSKAVNTVNQTVYTTIGCRLNGTNPCSGIIQDVRIYNHALSQAEIKELSNALVVHYTFDDILAEPTINLLPSSLQNKYVENVADAASYTITSGLTASAYTLSADIKRHIGDQSPSPYVSLNVTYADGTKGSLSTYTAVDGYNIRGTADGKFHHYRLTVLNPDKKAVTKVNGWILDRGTYTSGTPRYMTIQNAQLEAKDHATPYTVQNRPSLLQNEVGFNDPVNTNNITFSSDCTVGSLSFSSNSSGYIEQAVQGDKTHGTTASMWLKADLNSNWVAFADYGSQLGFGCYSKYGVIASVNGTNKRRASNLSSLWKTNDWNHVVVSMSSDNTVNRCWVNGTEVTYGSADYWTHTGKFTIGCRYNGSYSMNFPGLIDDFRFYHTCLSDADIQDLYHTKAMISNEGDILCGQIVENKSQAQVTKKYDFDTVECNEEINALYDCLEYLESTGTQYIDTGYVTTSSNYSYEVDIIPTTIGSFYSYMGFMASSQTPRAGLHEFSGTFMIGANATTNATGYSPVKNQRVRLKAVFKSGDQRLYKDGVLIVSNTTPFNHSANTLSTHIFARNYSSGRNQSKIKLFEALIYEGDYPVRRFVPVRRKSDNVLGLYETFTKTFYANSGTGTFTAGPTLTSDKALISSTHKMGGRNIIEI